MNKSMLKHEIRSMKWILLLSILASLLLVIMFSMNLANTYSNIFTYGMMADLDVVHRALRYIIRISLVFFSVITVIQVLMQFRPEKNQETARFLGSLPIKKEEFFRIKLITGIISLSIAFIILVLGIIIVRGNNMYWVRDIYRVSQMPEPYIIVDGVTNLLSIIGLIYLIVLSFYSFLFMVQYTFSHVVGGIVAGILTWLSPIFISLASIVSIERADPFSAAEGIYIRCFNFASEWLLPWLYPLDYNYNYFSATYGGIGQQNVGIIDNLWIKYLILLVFISVNIIIGSKLNQKSRLENENMVITFKSLRTIFKIGVTICSGLLLSIAITEVINIPASNTMYILLLFVGGIIGYFISNKIAQAGVK